jgi:peroxiredoxin
MNYPFPLLCDERRAVVRRYGVWHPLGLASFHTAHPSCFLVDAYSNLIRYAFVGQSQFARIDVDAILRALK